MSCPAEASVAKGSLSWGLARALSPSTVPRPWGSKSQQSVGAKVLERVNCPQSTRVQSLGALLSYCKTPMFMHYLLPPWPGGWTAEP